MKYRFMDRGSIMAEVQDILENRLDNWIKEVKITKQMGPNQECINAMLYLLSIYLFDYRCSPNDDLNIDLIKQAQQLLHSVDE